jgi:thioesterase domain-containing protein
LPCLENSSVAAGAHSGAGRRITELANIAFGREITRRVVDCILPLSDIGNGQAVYFVHSVTGSATDFRYLAQMLSPTYRFYGIQAPTQKRNAAFAASIEQIGKFYANRLNEFQPMGPLVLGGHSTGAVIALEMAQRLRALGREVDMLIVLDGNLFNTGVALDPVYWLKVLLTVPAQVRDILSAFRTFCRTSPRQLTGKTKSAIARLIGKRAGYTFEAIFDLRNYTPDHAAFVKALFESQFAYIPKKYHGRVVVCAAKTQPLSQLVQVQTAWSKIAPAAEIVRFDGTHASLLRAPDGLAVAEYLKNALASLNNR